MGAWREAARALGSRSAWRGKDATAGMQYRRMSTCLYRTFTRFPTNKMESRVMGSGAAAGAAGDEPPPYLMYAHLAAALSHGGTRLGAAVGVLGGRPLVQPQTRSSV